LVDLYGAHHTSVFFFKGEDVIRDDLVTGVQTCALPIFVVGLSLAAVVVHALFYNAFFEDPTTWGLLGLAALVAATRKQEGATTRSEERRVGKGVGYVEVTYDLAHTAEPGPRQATNG